MFFFVGNMVSSNFPLRVSLVFTNTQQNDIFDLDMYINKYK